MYKIEIINEVNGRKYGAKFADKDEKNAWIDKQISKDSWGKKQRWIEEEQMTDALRARILQTVVTPAVEEDLENGIEAQPEKIRHEVKPDYVVTETNLNLSKTYRNQKKREARRSEYPSLEEVLHCILDCGLDSQEMIDLQALRQSIKEKYPLE